MRRMGWDRILVATVLATVAALTDYVQAQEPDPKPTTGQRIGERLDEAAATIRRDVNKAGTAVREGFLKAKQSINAMGIEGRVYGRLRWDKALDGATLDVTAARDGTVTLTGSVADAAAKAKAAQLAAETIGVTRVVDQLSSPTPAPAASPAATDR